MPPTRLTVRPVSAEQHLDFVRTRRRASFLQTPAWGLVKSEWRHESIGWYGVDGELEGVALVLYRQLPRLQRFLAYLPEGPVIDWDTDDLAGWLDPMVRHLRRKRAFGIRIGPPVVTARWTAAQVKDGIARDDVRRLGDLPPTERSPAGARVVSQLQDLGWRPQTVEHGFAAGQPQYNFWLPLVSTGSTNGGVSTGSTDGGVVSTGSTGGGVSTGSTGGGVSTGSTGEGGSTNGGGSTNEGGSTGEGRVRRSEEDVLRGMNQLWRRNIKKAAKEGVVVERSSGSTDSIRGDLERFHDLYVHTAERDGFTPRPLSYFTTMLEALGSEDPDRISLYLATHDGDLVAATIAIRVGTHAWYSYGASSTEKREVRGSNAVQWAMIRDAMAAGAEVYDLRGITDTLDPEDPHVGLVQFKVGTGGEAVEYAGEWDLPVHPVLYKAFELYLGRRR